MLRTLSILAIVAAGLGALWAFSLAQSPITCEACIRIGGERVCRSASAGTEQEAARVAVATACGIAPGGVTEGMACTRTPPETLVCQ